MNTILSCVVGASMVLAAGVVTSDEVAAQQFHRDGGQSISLGYHAIDFTHAGQLDTLAQGNRFDFAGPAYSLVYATPRLLVSMILGVQDADADAAWRSLLLFDASMTTMGTLPQLEWSAEKVSLHLPFVLSLGYRRISPRSGSSLDVFNVSTVGMGMGANANYAFSRRADLMVYVHPVIGFTTSTLTDAFGLMYYIESGTQLPFAAVFGRLGLRAGYVLRYQIWDVNASNLFHAVTDELFDYRGLQHTVHLGVTF